MLVKNLTISLIFEGSWGQKDLLKMLISSRIETMRISNHYIFVVDLDFSLFWQLRQYRRKLRAALFSNLQSQLIDPHFFLGCNLTESWKSLDFAFMVKSNSNKSFDE